MPLFEITELTVMFELELLMKTSSPAALAVVPPAFSVPGVPATPIVRAPAPEATRMPPTVVTPPVPVLAPNRRVPSVVPFRMSMVRSVESLYLRVLALIVPVAPILTSLDVELLMI